MKTINTTVTIGCDAERSPRAWKSWVVGQPTRPPSTTKTTKDKQRPVWRGLFLRIAAGFSAVCVERGAGLAWPGPRPGPEYDYEQNLGGQDLQT